MQPGTACRARSSRDAPFLLRRPVAPVLARLLLASTSVPPSVVCLALYPLDSCFLLLTTHQRVAARLVAVTAETDTETTGADTAAVVAAAAEDTATTVATVATAIVTTVEDTTVATAMTVADTIEDTATTVEATTEATAVATIVEATTAETETLTAVGSTATPLQAVMTATVAVVVEEVLDSTALLPAMRLRPADMARVRVNIPCPAMVVTELYRCRPPCALSNFPAGVAPYRCVHGRSGRLL